MHTGHGAERAADVVERQVHVVQVGEIDQLAAVPQPDFLHVRRQDSQAALDDEALEIQAEIMVLAGGDGRPRIPLYSTDGANIFGRHGIFQPHQLILFDGARQIDRGLHAVVPMTIDGQSDLRAHSPARGGYERGHVFDLGCAEVAIILVGFVRRGNIDVKFQNAKTASHHFHRAASV